MEVHAWLVRILTGSDDIQHCSPKEVVFLTEGINLGQLQDEIENRFVGGHRMEIVDIKSLGPIGNRKP